MAEEDLASFTEVRNPDNPLITSEDLPELLQGVTACLTGWGTPPLSDEVLAQCPDLRMIAHTAGTVRTLVTPLAVERGLRLSHAAAIIGDAVAELVITQALLFMRPLHEIDRAMRTRQSWDVIKQEYLGRSLGSQTVGVVGVGRVGRTVIGLCKAFGCRVLAYDPYLTATDAAELGVEALSLDDLCAEASIVTIHAPVLPETIGMIGHRQLALLRDGAVFINTARAVLVDEEALFDELKGGRIVAGLDVFGEEPLPDDSPMRELPNVLLSPHLAGHTADTHLQQGQAMVDEIRRFFQGSPLQYEITPAMFSLIA